jgi:hypothetical protein
MGSGWTSWTLQTGGKTELRQLGAGSGRALLTGEADGGGGETEHGQYCADWDSAWG